VDGIDQSCPRVSVKELDDATRARRLHDLIDRRQERHQEARAAHAGGRGVPTIANHREPTSTCDRGRTLGRPDAAQRGKLQRKLAADEGGEATTDSHRGDFRGIRTRTACSMRSADGSVAVAEDQVSA
jgi:hypothetical protein